MAEATVGEIVAVHVKTLREQRGWSARELSEACSRAGAPTLTRSTIAKIESGVRRTVTVEELTGLARAFEISVDDLLEPTSAPEQAQVVKQGSISSDSKTLWGS